MIVARRAGLAALAGTCAGGVTVVADVALRTSRGAAADAAIFGRVSSSDAPRIAAVGQRAIEAISVTSVAATVAVLVVVALVTRRRRAAVEAVAIVACAILTAEAIKRVGVHFGLDDARTAWRGSFPSGHETLAAALGLSVVAAVPPSLKPIAALGGAVYAAGIGAALVLLQWHLPSDVVAAELIAGFWTATVLSLSSGRRVQSPFSFRTGLAVLGVGIVGACGAAYIGARHPVVAQETLSSGALVAGFCLFALVSFGIFGLVALFSGEEAAT